MPRTRGGWRVEEYHQNVTELLHFQDEYRTERAKKAVAREADLMLALFGNLDSLFVVDPESGAYEIFLNGADTIERDTLMRRKGRNLYTDAPLLADASIHAEDREQFLAYYSRENLMKIAETGVPQDTENRWRIQGEYRWKLNKTVRRVDENGKTSLILGVWNTTAQHESRRRAREAKLLLDGLLREYHATWTIDGKTHQLELFRQRGAATAPGSVEYGKAHPDYDQSIRWYADTYVDESNRERVKAATTWEAIVKNTPDEGIYAVTYKRHPRPGATDWHQVCFAKAENESGETGYVFAFRDVDMLVRDQIAVEERHRSELAEQNQRVLALSDNFESIYDVDLETGAYDVRGKSQSYREDVELRIVRGKDFFADLKQNIDRVVFREDRESFQWLTDAGKVKERLDARVTWDQYYRLDIEGNPTWFKMRVKRKGPTSQRMLLGVFNASEEIAVKEKLTAQQEEFNRLSAIASYLMETFTTAQLSHN